MQCKVSLTSRGCIGDKQSRYVTGKTKEIKRSVTLLQVSALLHNETITANAQALR